MQAEQLSNTSNKSGAALGQPGRYLTVPGNLRVKEVVVAPAARAKVAMERGRPSASCSAPTPNKPTGTPPSLVGLSRMWKA